jgi:hypothetical protein
VLRPGANLSAAMIASGRAESISVWAAAADAEGTTQVETGCVMSAPSALDTVDVPAPAYVHDRHSRRQAMTPQARARCVSCPIW